MTLVAHGQDFSAVPGVVINYEESPAYVELLGKRVFREPQVYLATPSITLMPNGDYFVSHDYFGSGTRQDTVKIFRSTDKGRTWTQTATIKQAFWSTIFQHDGVLYLWGYYEGGRNGHIVIRKSVDHGVTWTEPRDADNGLLRVGNFGGTANTPVIHNGRIWFAQGTRAVSAPVDSNLLRADSWTLTNVADTRDTPFGSGLTITEGQIVASPQTGVVVLPKIGGLPNTVLLRVSPTNPKQLIHPSDTDYVDLPGGDKKFGARYDPVSQKFYVLSNPVLPAHVNDSKWGDKPQLIRNTGAVLSSRDLRHWNVEKVFLYSENIDEEGFQYFNFVIDGDDLAVVSRTAFVIAGDNPPPRGHDSNLITFHRIENFRTLRPTYKLVLDRANNRILRYEATQYKDAPLGRFTLGSSFAGQVFSQPDGLAQDDAGDVYIHERNGRILRFDVQGNFLNVVNTLPPGIDFTTSPLHIRPLESATRSWIKSGDGD